MPQIQRKLRVLIVDDSTITRKMIAEILEGDPQIKVVGHASDGHMALKRVEKYQPDIVILDQEMPVMDGLTTLRRLKAKFPHIGVIMFSSFTTIGAETALRALELGAWDFVPKVQDGSLQHNRTVIAEQLIPKIKLYNNKLNLASISRAVAQAITQPPVQTVPTPRQTGVGVVAIAASTGGPNALHQLVPRIPREFPAPIAVVQHMPALFTQSLAHKLDQVAKLNVIEAEGGMTLEPGKVFIAPGGKHMGLKDHQNGDVIIDVFDSPPVNNCRPSADVLFRSVAEVFGQQAVGVVLTGMGADGRQGLLEMKRAGAAIIAQDRNSSVVWGMPRAVVQAKIADSVVPLSEMLGEIMRWTAVKSKNPGKDGANNRTPVQRSK